MTVYYLIDKRVKQRCVNEILSLDIEVPVKVTIKEGKITRSIAQNSLYWKWIDDLRKSGEFKDAEGKTYSKDQMHYELASAFLEPVQWTNRKGQKRFTVKSTKDLSVDDFSKYLYKIEALAQQMGVPITIPADLGYSSY